MARILALTLLAVAIAAAPADATLIGGPFGSPVRALDENLDPIEGSLTLPPTTRRTALSPDGTRVAALTTHRLVIADVDGGGTPMSFPARQAYQVLWPSAHHVVTAAFDARGVAVGSRDLRTGRTHIELLPGHYEELDDSGPGLGMVLVGEHGIRVARLDRAGRLRQIIRLPVPRAVRRAPYAAFPVLRNGIVELQWSQRVPVNHTALIRVATRTHRAIDLPQGGGYSWLTDDILTNGQAIVRIDRDTLGLVRSVAPATSGGGYETVTAPDGDGGVVVGLGHMVYDAELDLVADNPEVTPFTGRVMLDGDRLYHRTVFCGYGEDHSAVVVTDARTGETLRDRPGEYTIGTLGGRMDYPNDDDCD